MTFEPLTRLELKNFTTFKEIALDFSPGVNILVGENGTGKTHILKLVYALMKIINNIDRHEDKSDDNHSVIINSLFRSIFDDVFCRFNEYEQTLSRCLHTSEKIQIELSIERDVINVLLCSFCGFFDTSVSDNYCLKSWAEGTPSFAYLPTKDILEDARSMLFLFEQRKPHLSRIYADIIKLAYLPRLQESSAEIMALTDQIKKIIGSDIYVKDDVFFLKTDYGYINFSHVAEGHRKLALLMLLLQNGKVKKDSILLWDEPSSNLNPNITGDLVDILLELQRIGVQIFLATHSYFLLKEFDLRAKESDSVRYHSLFKMQDEGVKVKSVDRYVDIDPNAILDTFGDMHDRAIHKAIGDNK